MANYKSFTFFNLAAFWLACSLIGISQGQSLIDSLELLDPFSRQGEITSILSNQFSLLGAKNQRRVDELELIVGNTEKGGNESARIAALTEVGDIYFRAGMYNKALNRYFQVLRIYRSKQDTLQEAVMEIKISRTYYFLDIKNPRELKPDAYKILKNSRDTVFIALGYYVEGTQTTDPAASRALLAQALTLQRRIVQRFPNDSLAQERLAAILNMTGQYEEAIKIAAAQGNAWLHVLCLNNLGDNLIDKNKFSEALKAFKTALKICKQERFKTLLRNTFDNMARVYRLMGDWQTSSRFQQFEHMIEGSIYTERYALQAADFRKDEEAIKQDIENEYLKQEKAILTAHVTNERLINYFLAVSICGISLTTVLVFFSRRKMKKANRLLDSQKAEIMEQNEKLGLLYGELSQRETQLKEAQKIAQMANWELDTVDNCFVCSEQLLLIFDLPTDTPASRVRESMATRIHPEDTQLFNRTMDSFTEDDGSGECEYRLTIDETIKWIRSRRVLTYDDNRNVIKIHGTVQDITEAKIEEEMKISLAYQMSFNEQFLASQEEERKRIAGELHDGLGQEILLIKNRAQMGLQNENIDPASREVLTWINSDTSTIIKQVREISFDLRPAFLERLGLTETITGIIKRANQVSTIEIEDELENIDNLVPAEKEIHVFRIVQEGLNNILKHSNAQNASIRSQATMNEVRLTISDDGKGFDATGMSAASSGFGLENIKNRVSLLKGSLHIESRRGHGTQLKITIPIHTAHE